MFIEDLIHRMAGDGPFLFMAPPITMVPNDEKIISSMSSQLTRGHGFTEKQSVLALRLIKKYKSQLSSAINNDVTPFVDNPVFKMKIRVVDHGKRLAIVEEANNTKKILAQFPYNEDLIQKIRNFKKELSDFNHGYGKFIAPQFTVLWDEEKRAWTMPLWEKCIDWINLNLVPLNFSIDEELQKYINDIKNVETTIETFVPMLVFEENKFLFKNTHKNIPQPETSNLLEALFLSQEYGIHTWDETIDGFLNDEDINPVTRNFFRSPMTSSYLLNNEKYSLTDLDDILKYKKLFLFLIPGGSELENLKYCYNTLLEMGIPQKDMSVLFRLDNQTGKDFNELIKMFKLNNPLGENTKAIFVSGKIPKTLISFYRPIDVIINLGDNSAHYTQKNLVKNHHCVINYNIRKRIANV